MNLSVSLDGGMTYIPVTQGVRILYDGVDVPGEDLPGQLHLNATTEGLISDVWVNREDGEDHNIGTSSADLGALIGNMVDDNS